MKRYARAGLSTLLILLTFALTAPLSTEAAEGRNLFVTPTGSGRQDGSSWANAGTLNKLPTLVVAAGPGGQVLLRADFGPYRVSSPIIIRAGGTSGKKVYIRGVDVFGHPMKAEIIGTRADPYDTNGEEGAEVFRLMSRASNLAITQLHFRNIGNGAIRIAGDIEHIIFAHITARNVRRLVENYVSGGAASANVRDLVIRDVVVDGFSKGVMRLQYNSRDILIEDVRGDSQGLDGDNFAIGVHLDGSVHNVLLRRATMLNSHDSLHDYWNGDGFATEGGTYSIRFVDTVASGNTDAGYDLKSTQTTLIRASAEDNKRNYRVWGSASVQSCTGRDPRRRGGSGSQNQVWIGRAGKAEFVACSFSDSDPKTVVFQVEDTAALTVKRSFVAKHASARLSVVEPATFSR